MSTLLLSQIPVPAGSSSISGHLSPPVHRLALTLSTQQQEYMIYRYTSGLLHHHILVGIILGYTTALFLSYLTFGLLNGVAQLEWSRLKAATSALLNLQVCGSCFGQQL